MVVVVVIERGSVGVKINKLRYYVVVCMYKSGGGSYGDRIFIYKYVQEWFGLLFGAWCLFLFFYACSCGIFSLLGRFAGVYRLFPPEGI